VPVDTDKTVLHVTSSMQTYPPEAKVAQVPSR